MATKQSKLSQITRAEQKTKSVFNAGMLGNFNNVPSMKVNTDDYTYLTTELNNIIYDENIEYANWMLNSIKDGRLVNPVILSYDYTLDERAGREFRKKTGKYNIVDGNKRVAIYNRLFNDALANNDEEMMIKYTEIPSLLLPLNVSDDEIEKIKKIGDSDKSVSTQSVIKDITDTKNEEITYCYRYEAAEIKREDIVERDNKFKITQTEVDELEKSIYYAGLMQPLVLLPFIDSKSLSVKYEIEAGHKRNRAINQLVKHATEGMYPNGEYIIESYKTIPSVLVPMGATKEQVEKIYNDTNILSRHMTTDDVFEHIKYFDDLPSRPESKGEYVLFKEKKYRIDKLANMLQQKFKNLGFNDWQNRKSKMFLNVYYYGSDKALELFIDNADTELNLKDIEWIVTKYKDFNERKIQDEILEKSLLDKTYLLQLKEEKVVKKTPKKIKIRKVTQNLMKEKSALDKIFVTPFDLVKATQNDVVNARKILEELTNSLREFDERLQNINPDEIIDDSKKDAMKG